jgi:membrane protease subunit HflK
VKWPSARGLAWVAAFGLLALWCVGSTYTVRPSELGVVLRLGAPLPQLLRPGLHFCPRGIERVVPVEAARTFTMAVGEGADANDMPTPGQDSLWLTGDTNILAVRLALQYQVTDPVRYLLRTSETPEVLRRVTETAITENLARAGVDDVLTTGRAAFLESVRGRTQTLLDGYGAGVQVVSLALRSAEPPPAVSAAFKDVQDARSDRERLINQAHGYANETVPPARGQAQGLVSAAAGERNRRVETAKGDSERFRAVRAEASRAPGPFRQRVYLEALERLMPRMRVYVTDAREGGTRLHLVQRAPMPVAAPEPKP